MKWMKRLWTLFLWKIGRHDRCAQCKGTKGGAYGNENVIEGRLMCDYCHAAMLRKAKVIS